MVLVPKTTASYLKNDTPSKITLILVKYNILSENLKEKDRRTELLEYMFITKSNYS